ncbi:MAG: DUF3419 family protein [Clostridiales bacterium]|nr:DUF3419 family protein [Clostridiales bacterium]
MDKFDFYDTEYDYLTDYIFNLYNYDDKDTNTHPLYLAEAQQPNTAELKCYTTSNELLSAYMKRLNMMDKRVATVGSSGDQLLNAIYYGSEDITLIDGNPYSRAFVEYKLALLKNLSYEEFKSVSGDNISMDIFNYYTYRKISHDLSKPVRQFWDKIILEQSRDIMDTTAYNTYVTLCHPGTFYSNSDFYKFKSSYNYLQKLLRDNNFNVNYICSDLRNFVHDLDGTFDTIILSNIYDYEDGDVFATIVRDLYDNKLNPGGKIQAHYELCSSKGGGGLKARLSELDFETIDVRWGSHVWVINKPNVMEQVFPESTM